MTNNKIPAIIAICGYKRCGKDTIADYVSNVYNYKHLKISYKVKELVKNLFNITDTDYDNKKEIRNEYWGVSIRQMMQFIGTDMFQFKIQELIPDIGRDFWIKSLLSSDLINDIKNKKYNIVLSDLRFIHEYNKLKELNIPLVVIRVTNSNVNNTDNHISELEHLNIPFDYEIKNDGSITELYHNIDAVLTNYQNIQSSFPLLSVNYLI